MVLYFYEEPSVPVLGPHPARTWSLEFGSTSGFLKMKFSTLVTILRIRGGSDLVLTNLDQNWSLVFILFSKTCIF